MVGGAPLGENRPVGRRERTHDGPEQPRVAGVHDAHLHDGGGQTWRVACQEKQDAVLRRQPPGRAVEVEGHRARQQCGRRDASAHLGGADRGVGAAGRPAHHGEPPDPESLGEPLHVGRPVRQATLGLVGRQSHAGSVGRDEPNTLGDGGLVCRRRVEPGAQTAMEAEDGESCGVPVLLVGQHPAVGQVDESRHGRVASSFLVRPRRARSPISRG